MTHLRALSVPFKIVKTCQIPTFGHLLFCLTTSNPKINIGYAKQRADKVAAGLEKLGVEKSRISVSSYGDTVQPFAENDKNRCVIIEGK